MSKEKFARLAEKYMDTIFRVAYSWLKNRDLANDVTQEVLIKLYKTTTEFETEAHIKNWLIRVTANECKMIFRSPWSKREDIADYAETLGLEDESYSDLFQAVMKLDKKYSVPIMLFYYEGYSTAEISTMIGVPEKTVSTRLFRARTKLKDYLQEV